VVSIEVVSAPVTAAEVDAFLPRLSLALSGRTTLLPVSNARAPQPQLIVAARLQDPVDDVALLVPTSGSMGAPRLVMLSGDAMRYSADQTHHTLGGPGRWLLALPTTHIAGLQVLVRSLAAELTPGVVDMSEGFTADAFVTAVADLDISAAERPHYTALVPTQLRRLLDDGAAVEALWQLDAVLVGGAAAPPSLLSDAIDAGVTVVTTYGMTETCGGCVYDGTPLSGVDVSLDDQQRVRIRGPVLFCGYRDSETTSTDDGWLTTSDVGYFDNEGRLQVDGRFDNVIVSGGVNVPADAVEHALSEAPGVRAVVVVGRDDNEWGQVVTAVIASDAEVSTEELREFGRGRIESTWLPRSVIRVDALPLLDSGKPDRVAAKQLAEDWNHENA
jgi:O-succinylbenzoic acid--CoA ligase